MAIKNMGTSTMRFKQGIFVEGGADVHGQANQLVTTGSISVMGTGVANSYSAAPTNGTYDRNEWYYIPGNSQSSTNTAYEPRTPTSPVPVDDGSTTNSAFYTFWAGNISVTNVERMISLKTGVTGDVTISFKIIAGGNNDGSGGNNTTVTETIPLANQASTFPSNFADANQTWTGGSVNSDSPVQIAYATTGFEQSDNWTPVSATTSTNFRGHHSNHSNAADQNINVQECTTVSYTITGISGTFYVGIIQDDNGTHYNSWAITDLVVEEGFDQGYINFEGNSFSEGSDGFGFRNNAGVMEFKDEGSDWKGLGDMTPAGHDGAIQFNNNGAFGGGNFFYDEPTANIGIGDFTNSDPSYLLTIQGDKGGSGNNAYVNIVEHNDGTGPGILYQRHRGSLASPADIQDDDILGQEVYIGQVGGGIQILAGQTTRYHSTNGSNIVFSVKGQGDAGNTNKLLMNGVSLMPHPDITTSNKGAYVLGGGTNAYDTLYCETLQGPQGMDMKVVADNNDVIMHIGTQGTYEGNVGIGMETPQAPLHVQGEVVAESVSSAGGLVTLLASKTDWAHLNAGATLGKISFGAVDMPTTSNPIYGGAIEISTTEQWSNGNYGSQIEFNVHANSQGSHSMGVTKMILSGDTLDLNVDTADFGGVDMNLHAITATGDIDTTSDMSCNNLSVTGQLSAGSFAANTYNNAAGNSIFEFDTSSNDIVIGATNQYDFVIQAGSSVGTNQEMVKIDTQSETTHLRGPVMIGNHDDIHVSGSITTSATDHQGCVPSPGGYAAPSELGHKSAAGWPFTESQWNTRGPVLYVESVTGGHTTIDGNVDPFIATFVNPRNHNDTDGIQIIIGRGQNDHVNGFALTSPAETNRYMAFCSPTYTHNPNVNTPVNGGQLGEHYFWDGVISVGSISGDGSGGIRTNGISFTGTHDACSSEAIEPGMIVDSTGEMWISLGMNTSLPFVAQTTAAKSKTVFGVIESNEIRSGRSNSLKGKNGYTVNGLGEGKVWVTTITGEPSNGDYITSSPIVGHGQLQDDDILHSYTVAKLTEAIDWSTVEETIDHEGNIFKRYLAGCTYHCG